LGFGNLILGTLPFSNTSCYFPDLRVPLLFLEEWSPVDGISLRHLGCALLPPRPLFRYLVDEP